MFLITTTSDERIKPTQPHMTHICGLSFRFSSNVHDRFSDPSNAANQEFARLATSFYTMAARTWTWNKRRAVQLLYACLVPVRHFPQAFAVLYGVTTRFGDVSRAKLCTCQPRSQGPLYISRERTLVAAGHVIWVTNQNRREGCSSTKFCRQYNTYYLGEG